MPNEATPYHISPSQPLMTDAAEGVSHRTDIGEAKVIKTMFGKAKIRVISSQSKHSLLWSLLALILTLVAAGVWLEETGLLHQERKQDIHSTIALPEFAPPKSPPEVLPEAIAKQPPVAATSKPSLKKAVKVRKKAKPKKTNIKSTPAAPLTKPSISSKPPVRKPKPAPVEPAPVEPAPVEPAPVVPTPVVPTPVVPTPVVPTPVEPTPVEPAPVKSVPVESVPPVEAAPSIEPDLEVAPPDTTPQQTDTALDQ